MIRIYIIRHGETEWNKKESFRGTIDIPLNKNGLNEAKYLSLKLKDKNFTKIFSSPLKRAMQTAEEIAQYHNAEIEITPDLIDINFGKWQGLSLESVKKKFKNEFKIWINTPDKIKFENGECLEDVRRRISNFFEKTILKYKEGNLAFVSHRVINKVLILYLLNIDNCNFWKIKQDTASYTVFEKNNFGWVMILHNDICHLNQIKKHKAKDF